MERKIKLFILMSLAYIIIANSNIYYILTSNNDSSGGFKYEN